MIASRDIKIDSFERLLKDPRVNVKPRTKRNQTCYDLLPVHALPAERDRIKTLFEIAKKRGSAAAKKSEITSQMTSLEGTRENWEELLTFQCTMRKKMNLISYFQGEPLMEKCIF